MAKTIVPLKTAILGILLMYFIQSHEFLGYYPYDVEPTATYQCLKGQGYSKIVIWAESTPKGIDP